jgi:hypothetical protein
MFVVKGVSELGPPLNLKVLLDTRADCLYVSWTVATKIGELRKGQPVIVNLPLGKSISSNNYAKIFVQISTYRLAVKCTMININGYNLVLGET